jgi:hypothetical protein
MTLKTTSQDTSPNPQGRKARRDKERDTQEAVVEDAGDMEDKNCDLVNGEGGPIDLPTKPDDLSKDD